MEAIWAAGLMTGTVLDGNIDVSLIKTDGEKIESFGPYCLAPYPQWIRNLLEEAQYEARTWAFNGPEPAIFAKAEKALTIAQSSAVSELVQGFSLSMSDIGIVGFHGQTVLHRAPQLGRLGQTRQLGYGKLMHSILGVRVAYDFRSADMLAGGQGAPLAAIYHAALLDRAAIGSKSSFGRVSEPDNRIHLSWKRSDAAILNLGGVGNITWSDGKDNLVAFDTGPANAPLNDFMKSLGRGEMDRDGKLAAAGIVDEARLFKLLQHPYLSAPYPKSLDRFDFGAEMADGLSPENGAATLCAFSAACVGKALDLLPLRPQKIIVCGGGRRNPTMMAMLVQRAGVDVVPAEALGWSGDAVEAECFAFLAVRVLRGLAITFPSTTGAPKPMCGGKIAG